MTFGHQGKWAKAVATVATVATITGCTPISRTYWQRMDGSFCATTNVKPRLYSSETETDCMVNGKPVQVTTNHEDISITLGLMTVLAAFLSGL